MDDEIEVQIITPPTANLTDQLDHGLVALTEAICQATGAESGFGLGGRFGYGENYENGTFAMHRFCWCESEDCPWCMGCDCPDDSYHYLIDGKEVTSKEWVGFYKDFVGHGDQDHAEYMRKAKLANARRGTRHDTICDYCTKGRFLEHGAVAGKSAPNFWHKPSGLRVWWYKWIGRGMEVEGADGADLQAIFKSCVSSLMVKI